MARAKFTGSKSDSSANLGFEAKLLLAWDKLRTNMDAGATTEQSLTLATLRDTLLPKLLSGELSVEAVSQT